MAFQEANWSPTFTLTEDFALGMYLKMNKWHCRYVEEYLAIGEAPDQVRNCFQQRSRWTKVLSHLARPSSISLTSCSQTEKSRDQLPRDGAAGRQGQCLQTTPV